MIANPQIGDKVYFLDLVNDKVQIRSAVINEEFESGAFEAGNWYHLQRSEMFKTAKIPAKSVNKFIERQIKTDEEGIAKLKSQVINLRSQLKKLDS
jgi:hypothetical protein